jgi:hypothetical protein
MSRETSDLIWGYRFPDNAIIVSTPNFNSNPSSFLLFNNDIKASVLTFDFLKVGYSGYPRQASK